MTIWCTGCQNDVPAVLTDGRERYPHRPDLSELVFWKCETCSNFVGCHPGTNNPLGCIATPEIVNARKKIHEKLDPLWKDGGIKRGQAYAFISHRIGKQYHTGEIRSIEEAWEIYRIVKSLSDKMMEQPTK